MYVTICFTVFVVSLRILGVAILSSMTFDFFELKIDSNGCFIFLKEKIDGPHYTALFICTKFKLSPVF